MITQGIETAGPLLREKQNDVSIFWSYRPLYVFGDAARLAQCVSNLVTNAAKYTDQHGRISIKMYADNATAVIEVTDNGYGIAGASGVFLEYSADTEWTNSVAEVSA